MEKLFDILSRKFWIRSFLFLITVSVIMKLFGVAHISDALILGLVAHANTMIGLNAWEKVKKG